MDEQVKEIMLGVRKLLACLAWFMLVMAISIVTMIYGWGLTPVSWTWIIGGGVASYIVVTLVQLMAKK